MTGASVTSPAVLLLGGYGSLGSRTARALRVLHPQLPVVIAGRDPARAAAVADDIGGATHETVDLTRDDLGLRGDYSVVVTALRDLTLNSLRFAQTRRIPYAALSDGVPELGPLVAQYVARPAASPVLMLGHAMGGVPALAALHVAREFRTVDTVEIGLLFDAADPLGPASAEDMARIERIAPSPLVLDGGRWRWVADAGAERRFADAAGREHAARAVALSDLLSLSALEARTIRVDVAMAATGTRPHGASPALEVIIEIVGERRDGRAGRFRYVLVEHEGYAMLSARGVAIAVERLLGLAGGPPPGSGLYLPETIMDPGYLVDRLTMFGLHVTGPQPAAMTTH